MSILPSKYATQKAISITDNCFDLIRCMCAFTIFLGHFITHYQINNNILHTVAYIVRGVPVFFLLSGFFIANSLEHYDTITFIKKRLLRIFPALWLCVLFSLAIILATYETKPSAMELTIYLITRLSFFQFYTGEWLREYGVGSPNGALWTITVTIQFYIFALLTVRILKRLKLRSWIIMILTGIVIDNVIYHLKSLFPASIFKLLQCNIISFLWIFLLGMMLYYHKDEIIPALIRIRIPLVVMYLLWYFIAPDGIKDLFTGVRFNIITTLLLLLMTTAIGFSFICRLKKDLSYSFFLYHMVIINIFYHSITKTFFNRMHAVMVFAAIAVITILVAYISSMLSEKITHRLTK